MLKQNQNITDYLKFYCKDVSNPQFGIMIKGTWGCGKTWFIKDFINNNDTLKFLYISLYGLSSTKEIDDKIFECLHPILASKSVKFIGKIAQSALRLGLKIPLSDDSNLQGTASIPNLSLSDFSKNFENQVIIFDDFERCNIEMNLLLGYINTFIEHFQLKVIVVGNELELSKNAKGQFLKSKEKIISQLFEISPVVDDALNHFIEEIYSPQCKEFLKSSKEIIKELFQNVGYNNLRDLRQALINFEYFYLSIEETFKKETDFIKNLLKIFIYLTLEEKANEINRQNWKDSLEIFFSRNLSQKSFKVLEEHERSNIEKDSLYSRVFSRHETPLIDLWEEITFDGKIDKIKLNETIGASKYFIEKNKSNLGILLSDWRSLSPDQFKITFESFYQEFINKKYVHPGEILHCVGELLMFQKWGLIDKERSKIKETAIKIIGELSDEDKIQYVKFHEFLPNDFGGYGFGDKESEEFKEVWEYLKEKMEKNNTADIKSIATSEVNAFPETYNEFCRSLITVEIGGKYGSIPILSWINIENFFQQYMKVSNLDKSLFIYALEDRYLKRYSNGKFPEEYSTEIEALEKLRELFDKKIQKEGLLFRNDNIVLKWNLERLEEIIKYSKTKKE